MEPDPPRELSHVADELVARLDAVGSIEVARSEAGDCAVRPTERLLCLRTEEVEEVGHRHSQLETWAGMGKTFPSDRIAQAVASGELGLGTLATPPDGLPVLLI
jgi:hypothetical protein